MFIVVVWNPKQITNAVEYNHNTNIRFGLISFIFNMHLFGIFKVFLKICIIICKDIYHGQYFRNKVDDTRRSYITFGGSTDTKESMVFF